MPTAQTIAAAIREHGLSDSQVAQYIGSTREYVNRVRNGHRLASYDYTQRLQALLDQVQSTPAEAPAAAVNPGVPQEHIDVEVSANGIPTKYLVIGGIVVVIIAGCILLYLYRKKKQEQEKYDL
jgi:transcriptional regulator with XRE-family HTH domain